MMQPCSHDSHEKYEKLIGPLREVARSLGYALAVHGSLVRDIDLIAVPWTREAVAAHELAEAIGARVGEINGIAFFLPGLEQGDYFRAGCPGGKPHQRLGWTFHLGGGPYIDLAVMPRADDLDMRKWCQEVGLEKVGKTSKTLWQADESAAHGALVSKP